MKRPHVAWTPRPTMSASTSVGSSVDSLFALHPFHLPTREDAAVINDMKGCDAVCDLDWIASNVQLIACVACHLNTSASFFWTRLE